MIIWDQDKYIKAWNFASIAHKGQLLPGTELPYINHIGNVTMEVMSAIVATPSVKNSDLSILCALLHDTIEDTDVSFDNLLDKFGKEVASGVLSLTKNSDLPSKEERMDDSLKRIIEQPKEVWVVKLADRITNLQPPPSYWNNEKINKYRREAMHILEVLGISSEFLAKRLQNKIQNYKKFC